MEARHSKANLLTELRPSMTAGNEVDELRAYCKSVTAASEGGCTYYLLEGLILPEGCSPAFVDALLCPTPRDGYNSRLFFAERVAGGSSRNWNTQARILERNWHAYSWSVNTLCLRLAQLVSRHLEGLTR